MLEDHQLKKHSEKKFFTCPTCQKQFSRKHNLNQHVNVVHQKVKPLSCKFCNKSFAFKKDLTIHIRSHTKEKPFKCSQCEKHFSSKTSLNTHTKAVHDKLMPYSCTLCEKSFAQKGNLVIHIRNHTEEKMFSCSLCTKRFYTAALVKRHINLSHMNPRLPYRCTWCRQLFTKNTTLLDHIRKHQKIKQLYGKQGFTKDNYNSSNGHKINLEEIQCSVCAESFTNTTEYTHHLKVHLQA